MEAQAAGGPVSPRYPVTFGVQPQLAGRNRLTVGFRFILAIPQALLVGGPGPGLGFGWWRGAGPFTWIGLGGGSGAIGIAAGAMAAVSWFAVVFTGKQPRGLWDFTLFYMRWRANVLAYTGLLRDEYPPFGPGDGSYPVSFGAGDFPETRERWSVGLRAVFVIPHLVVLVFLSIAWLLTAIIAWFAILFTGNYPQSLYDFAVGYMRWTVRVQAYFLLMRDEYPPFSLE